MALGARWLGRTTRSLLGDERGNAAIIFGLAVLPLMAGAGLATDTLIAYSVEDQLQKSLDAAGLAAGRAVEEDDIEADATAFLRANFNAGPGLATLADPDVQVDDDNGRIVLTATATMPTHVMHLFGQDTVTISARTVINREIRQMELALVLDNTGSMWGAPFTTMQAAAKDLVDIVYGEEDEHPNLWVSVVPYVSVVNIGNTRTDWIDSGDRVRSGSNAYAPSTWKGCVMARGDGYDQTDDPPSVRGFTSFLYPDDVDNDWGAPRTKPVDERLSQRNEAYGPNLGCGPPILPLTASKATVHATLDGMGAWSRGGTAGNEGMAWGWRVLSPRWRGLWGGDTPDELPLAYNAELTDKIVVMLTDGNNEVYDNNFEWRGSPTDPTYTEVAEKASIVTGPRGSDYTSHGRLWDFIRTGATHGQGRAEWDKRMTKVCTSMKQHGIIVYTITFGKVPNASTQTLYRNCATRAEFYSHAPDNATLRTVFKKVGMQLSNLRIAE